MRRVMIVHPDIEMLDEMGQWLAEKFPGEVVTDKLRNQADAAKHCQAAKDNPYQAIIVNKSIAAGVRIPLSEAESRGLRFLESLEELGHGDVPKILMAPAVTEEIFSRTRALRRFRLLVIDDATNFEEKFIQVVTEALSDSPEEVRKAIKVIVRLNLEKELWDYQIKSEGFTYEQQDGVLALDSNSLKRLVGRSQRAANQDYPDWKDELLDVGQELGRLLIYGNPPFHDKLVEGQTKAGGPDRKSICFAVEKSVHPVALEALTLPDNKDFWMVKVPIFRRLFSSAQDSRKSSVLFDGRRRRPEPFSALIIESPADGTAERLRDDRGQLLQVEALGKVGEEADAVEAALRTVAKCVVRIGPRDIPLGQSFKSYLQEKVEGQPWDLVHYVGHSHYEQKTGKGYLLLPGAYVADLDIEIFSAWLSQTRFLYLSGCRSAEDGFVFELARLQMPGVLGFRWPVDDWAALEFAREFYRNLFPKDAAPSLERAFLSTRQAMWRDHQDNKIWAAAMLILQGAD